MKLKKTQDELKKKKERANAALYQRRRQKKPFFHDRDSEQRRVNKENKKHGNPFKPIPTEIVFNTLDLWGELSNEDKTFIDNHKEHFLKEHYKYLQFLDGVTGYRDKIAKGAEEIICIGVGATIELTDYGEWVKNEVLALIELGYRDKLILMGLRGNGINPIFDESKEIKYRMWLNVGIHKENIIRCFVTKETLNLIPYSTKETLIIVLIDGTKKTTDEKFMKLLRERRPNSTIDYFTLARIRATEKGYPKDIKLRTRFNSHSHSCLRFLRKKNIYKRG